VRPDVATVRVGTRGSRLALWQAEHVAACLRREHPGLVVERRVVSTAGDLVIDVALSRVGDKGLFTRELEEALGADRIDVAVHSLKDLPTEMPEGLALGAVMEREDPRDVLVGPWSGGLDGLPEGARVGTSSLRRRAQALARRPDLRVVDLRGNVPTRLSKLERGDCDAAVLALAGLRRLGLEHAVGAVLQPDVMLPAAGQGALAVQCRRGDARVSALLDPLDHGPTRLAVAAERALLARLEGGCQVPVGCLATPASTRLRLRGLVADVDGSVVVTGVVEETVGDELAATGLGERLAERLLGAGAREILARVRAAVAEGTVSVWGEA
jgi:hydroxymethylbilane synthase